MKPTQHILPILVTSFLVMLLVACSGNRQVATQSPVAKIDSRSQISENKDLLAQNLKEFVMPERLKMPVTINLTAPTKFKLSGKLSMVRDEVVYVSLQMLGFEVGSVWITSDSVFAREKFHKYYLAESLDALLKGLDLKIGHVQSLVTGHLFVAGSNSMKPADFSTESIAVPGLEDAWVAIPKCGKGYPECQFLMSGADCVGVAFSGSGVEATCGYENFVSTSFGKLASKFPVTVQRGDKTFVAEITTQPNKASADVDIPKWKQPDKSYKRLTLQQLLTLLGKL